MNNLSGGGHINYQPVGLIAGRITGFCAAVIQAHEFGAEPGQFDDMTAPDYHRAAVDIYHETIPWSFLVEVADGFDEVHQLMNKSSPPPGIEPAWYAIERYLSNTTRAIRTAAPEQAILNNIGDLDHLQPNTPPVMPFHHLAELVTTNAPHELHTHATTIHQHIRGRA